MQDEYFIPTRRLKDIDSGIEHTLECIWIDDFLNSVYINLSKRTRIEDKKYLYFIKARDGNITPCLWDLS
jgi:hypothetical protein